jgi:hypothetical protein
MAHTLLSLPSRHHITIDLFMVAKKESGHQYINRLTISIYMTQTASWMVQTSILEDYSTRPQLCTLLGVDVNTKL